MRVWLFWSRVIKVIIEVDHCWSYLYYSILFGNIITFFDILLMIFTFCFCSQNILFLGL